jgi:hypothetical protein
MLFLLGLDLAAQDLIEEIAVGEIAFRGLFEERGQLGPDALEAEPLAKSLQSLDLGRAHAATSS